jgi:hypothetical protein
MGGFGDGARRIFLFHVSLAALTGRWKTRALLFFVEVKAVQNAMGERGYDHGCYSDKSQSGKQSITGSKYFDRRRMESIHGSHSGQNH